jgi:hypothetical protein
MTATTTPAPAGFTRRQYARQILGNVIAAPVFVVLVSQIPEPYRQWSMALLMGVAAVVYLGHGLGRVEWLFAAAIGVCALAGVASYAAIGVGWLVHTVSDAWHHRIDRPMTPRIPMSSFGCAVFDPLIAIWFFLGAPTVSPF